MKVLMTTSGISVRIVRIKIKIRGTETLTQEHMRWKVMNVTTVKNVESACVSAHR